jgi:hypothetical protein
MLRAFRLGNSFWSNSHFAGIDIAIASGALGYCNELCSARLVW